MWPGSDEAEKAIKKMRHKNYILVTAAAVAVFVLTGCGESNSRVSSAERRWERVMEKARIEAAQESIEQGRLQYAIRLLEDLVESDSAFADQAGQILEQLKAARQEIAQARAESANVEL
jgi:Tfp pilus assembly protein PilF